MTSFTGFIPSQLQKPVAVTTVYSVPDDGRKGRPKHVQLLTPNKEYKKVTSHWQLYYQEFYCLTVHFNSLNATHQLMHFQYNNTRVAQKVMPHIFFLGNYLIRMYETHAQYNWMFPLHVLFFHIISI